ncbi:hypothetical protein [Burkholderia cenocepacia]|uniref:hypothetical protein n=1 Tax=Burkholderia cenocepacia TaxID=95486 RepID=UPI00192B9070|nr:hypothetical protein [Burkholderia cenocepacia]
MKKQDIALAATLITCTGIAAFILAIPFFAPNTSSLLDDLQGNLARLNKFNKEDVVSTQRLLKTCIEAKKNVSNEIEAEKSSMDCLSKAVDFSQKLIEAEEPRKSKQQK